MQKKHLSSEEVAGGVSAGVTVLGMFPSKEEACLQQKIHTEM